MDVPLKILPKLAIPKAYVLWFDDASSRWIREEITREAYKALGGKPFPDKPAAFNGSQDQWETIWKAGPTRAKAIDGRPVDGGTKCGDVYIRDNGSAKLFLGDIDNDGSLSIPKEDYTGTPDKMTVTTFIPIQGVTIENGILKGI